jgi:hypothetical protein
VHDLRRLCLRFEIGWFKEVCSPTGKLDESICVRDQILCDAWLFAKRKSREQAAKVQRLRSRLCNILL